MRTSPGSHTAGAPAGAERSSLTTSCCWQMARQRLETLANPMLSLPRVATSSKIQRSSSSGSVAIALVGV